MLSRFTVAICVSVAGVEDKRRLLSGGTGFLAISGNVIFRLGFYLVLFWRGPCDLIYNCDRLVVSGGIEEIFTHVDEFPLAVFVVLGVGVESVVDSSLSCVSSPGQRC